MTPRSRVFLSSAVLAAFAGLGASAAFAEDINIPMDQTQIVTFAMPVKTVFVGNPLVADVNVLAPLELVRAALPWLEKTRGAVVNIGSVNAHCGEPGLLPYSLSKAALQAATRNLGDTLFGLHGVRVNQVNPGWVLTANEIERKRAQGLDDDWPARVERRFAPAGRLIAPEEIAAVVVTFLSDECGPVSGQVCDLEQYPLIGRNPPKTILPRDA